MNITFGGSGRCGTSLNLHPAAMLHYEGASGNLPTDTGSTPIDHQCLDLIDLSPVVRRTVPTTDFSVSDEDMLYVQLNNTFRKWTVSGSSQVVDWSNPVVQYVLNNDSTTWPGIGNENVRLVDESADEASETMRGIYPILGLFCLIN